MANIKWTDDKIKEKFKEIAPDYKLLEIKREFKKMLKILIKCPIKNHKEYWAAWQSFLGNRRCRQCSGLNKKTTEQYKLQVEEKGNNEYSLKGEYVGNKVKILHHHLICGNDFLMRPNDFLSGRKCPKCFAKNHKKTTDEFKKEVFDLVNNEYDILGEYIKSNFNILFKHNVCGYSFSMRPNSFLNGQRCPKCSNQVPITTEMFSQKVFNLVGDEYTVVSNYIHSKKKIKMYHKICKNVFEMKPNSFLQGQRCPICNESKGEQKIRKYLENNKFIFKNEFKFNNLNGLGGGKLRFDFAIFEDKEKTKLKCLIEYDGKQHSTWVESFMSKDDFILIQKHDKLKNQYCKTNNIPLLRINYTYFDNIEEILEEYIDNLNIKEAI